MIVVKRKFHVSIPLPCLCGEAEWGVHFAGPGSNLPQLLRGEVHTKFDCEHRVSEFLKIVFQSIVSGARASGVENSVSEFLKIVFQSY